MTHPLTVCARRVRRILANSRPELRIRAQGEIGIYPEKGAAEPLVNLKFDQNTAAPLLKAAAVALAIVAVVDLLDD